MKYTLDQLMQLWKQAGGAATAAPLAAAIAMAESGGESTAINKNGDGSTDRGLWQINSVHGSQSTNDPMANARAAVTISSNGTNWRPWCVAWSNGRCGGTFMGDGSPVFKFFNGSPVQTAQNVSTGGGIQAQGVSNPFDPNSWAQAFLTPIFRSTWFAILAGIGLLFMLAGVLTLVYESKAAGVVRKIGGKAAMAAPQTRAVGAAVTAKEEAKEEEAAPEYEGRHREEGSSDDTTGRHAAGGGRHRAET